MKWHCHEAQYLLKYVVRLFNFVILTFLLQCGLMVCGIDTYHKPSGTARSVGGFVASMNSYCTRWFSKVCQQLPGEELVHGLRICFVSAIRKYHQVILFVA